MPLVNVKETYRYRPDSLHDPFVNQLSAKMFGNRIRFSLIENMKSLGGNVNCLFDIEKGKISTRHITEKYQRLYSREKDLVFLWSALVKRHDLLQLLYEIDAYIHSTVPKKGYTALHLAAFSGCVKSCKWLILHGLDINVVVERVSPLDCAVVGNSLGCTELLLGYGATFSNTILHRAVRSNAIDCLKVLLSKNTNINAVDENGFTALHVAANLSKEKCLGIILSHPKVDLNLRRGLTESTPLHLAAKSKNSECCRLPIENGAHVNAVNDKEQTALHVAAKTQSTACVKILLDAGCDINAQDVDGRTPLHMTLEPELAFDVLDVLLKRGADVNLTDKRGYTPLHIAGLKEMSQCVVRFITSGADVTAKTRGGVSALSLIGRRTPGSVNAICHKLDSSISMSEYDALGIEVEVRFDFHYLLQNSLPGEVGFLKTLKVEEYNHLVEHPLCRAFLYLKWQKIRKFYFSRLLFYFVFVVLFAAYVIYAVGHECCNAAILTEACESCASNFTLLTQGCEVCVSNSTNLNNATKKSSIESCRMCLNNDTILNISTRKNVIEACRICLSDESDVNIAEIKFVTKANEACSNNSAVGSFLIEHPYFIEFIWYLLALMAILELIWLVTTSRYRISMKLYRYYLIIFLDGFVLASVFDVSYWWKGQTFERQKVFGSLSVLLAWTNFMFMVGQLPIFGTYVAMYTKVQTEFLKLLVAYSYLLIGFTVSFCVIFPSEDTYQNPLIGLVKILVMMTGDLNFTIFRETLSRNPSAMFSFIAHIIYVLFLLFVTVVLMNLLVGIAVHDIQSLHKTANICKLIRQTELIYYIEKAISRSLMPERISLFLLRQLALSPPQANRTVFRVKPLHPRERRLPKEIMMAAFDLAKQKKKWTSTACCWSDTIGNCTTGDSEQDEVNLHEEVRQLKEMVQAQNALISELVKKRCGSCNKTVAEFPF